MTAPVPAQLVVLLLQVPRVISGVATIRPGRTRMLFSRFDSAADRCR
jgi:hypothetical protein